MSRTHHMRAVLLPVPCASVTVQLACFLGRASPGHGQLRLILYASHTATVKKCFGSFKFEIICCCLLMAGGGGQL